MRKVLGTKEQFYIQTNNAQVALFHDYFKNGKMIACGPTAAVMCLAVTGWPLDVFTPGEQPEDGILMVAHNPNNLPLLQRVRNIDYDQYPPNEVPQVYPVIMDIIYQQSVCAFEWGLSYEIIRESILKKESLLVCGDFPAGGHYVAIVGFDDEKNVVIFNDPYPPQWPDKNGYNREMDIDFLKNNMQKHRVIFRRLN